MALVSAVERRAARVLVVDDSVVVRQVLSRALEAEPGLELAGVAANGRIAIEKLARLDLDAVLLDLDMPEMNGFETLASIRRTHPALPIIVFSHLTSEGATATLDALAEIVPTLPADLAVPIFIVQHMPALFTKTLAERLDRAAAVEVVEATNGDLVVPGRVYLAPGGHHLALTRVGTAVTVSINDDPPENSCRPAADVLFRSAAEVYGNGVLAVVLTGMGHDGLRGSAAVCAAGGSVIAQDAETAVVASMPGAVVAAGLTDAVVPLDGVAPELLVRLSGRR